MAPQWDEHKHAHAHRNGDGNIGSCWYHALLFIAVAAVLRSCCNCKRSKVSEHLQLLAGSLQHHRAGFGGLGRETEKKGKY